MMTDDNHTFGDHSRPGQEVGSAEELWQSQDGRVGSHGSGSTGGGRLGSPRRDTNSGSGGGEEEQQHRGSNAPPSAGTASPLTSGEGSRSRPESVVGVSSQIRGYVTRKVPVQRAAAAAAGASRLFATPAALYNDDDEEEGCGEEEMDDDPPPAPKSEDFLALAMSSVDETIKAVGASLTQPASLGSNINRRSIQKMNMGTSASRQRRKGLGGGGGSSGGGFDSQLGMCTLVGATLYFQKGSNFPGGGSGDGQQQKQQQQLQQPPSSTSRDVFALELSGTTAVTLSKDLRELCIRVPTFSSDSGTAIVEEMIISAPPPHFTPQCTMRLWRDAVAEACEALRAPLSRQRVFVQDRAKPNVYHALQERSEAGGDDEGEDDGGADRRHEATVEFAERFNKSMQEFEMSFGLITSELPGHRKSAEAEAELENRLAGGGRIGSSAGDVGRGGDGCEQQMEAWEWCDDVEPVVERGKWNAADLWDFEPPPKGENGQGGYGALRHITLGISIVLGGGDEVGFAASTGGGIEIRVGGDGRIVRGGVEGGLNSEERMASLSFASRLIGDAFEEIEDESGAGPGSDELPSTSMTKQQGGGGAGGGDDERDWVPVHDWSQAILVKGERIDPINLTCEGYGQIWWKCEPKLPPGLTFSRVDGNSCQITGTPESSSEDSVPYMLTAYNRLGQSCTEVTIMVMDPPHDLSFSDHEIVAKVGKSVRITVDALQGTPPMKLHVSEGELPDGLRLDNFTGTIEGIIRATLNETRYVTVVAVNAVGKCGFQIMFAPDEERSEAGEAFFKQQQELSQITFEMPKRLAAGDGGDDDETRSREAKGGKKKKDTDKDKDESNGGRRRSIADLLGGFGRRKSRESSTDSFHEEDASPPPPPPTDPPPLPPPPMEI